MRTFGLIGTSLKHSFSKQYFSKKFIDEGIGDAQYQFFELENLNTFSTWIRDTPHLAGLNVTIPYKERIIPYLDELDEQALEVGAVNTIKILKEGRLKGYNTDVWGFESTIPNIKKHPKALILGTGGASKAIVYVLRQAHIDFLWVSRNPSGNQQIAYDELNAELIRAHTLIVNTTPLGTFPKTDECPAIPYEHLTNSHILYDLVYNPEDTLFLKSGRHYGAKSRNGLPMLYAQAERSWQIWNE